MARPKKAKPIDILSRNEFLSTSPKIDQLKSRQTSKPHSWNSLDLAEQTIKINAPQCRTRLILSFSRLSSGALGACKVPRIVMISLTYIGTRFKSPKPRHGQRHMSNDFGKFGPHLPAMFKPRWPETMPEEAPSTWACCQGKVVDFILPTSPLFSVPTIHAS